MALATNLTVGTVVDGVRIVNVINGPAAQYDTEVVLEAGGVEDAFVAGKTDYSPGDEFIQARNADGALFLFRVPAGYVGPAGAVWDATEEARYEAISDAPQTPHTPLGVLAAPLATTAATTAEVAAALAALPPPRTFATAPEALAGTEASKVIAPDVLKAELDRRELALDFDQYQGAQTVAGWSDAALPVAQANHFFRFADSGTVATLLGVTNVEVQRGDVVRATVDGTVAATVGDWQLIPVSPAVVSDAITDTTDGMTLEWGKRYLFYPAFNYNWPPVTETAGSNWMDAEISNSDWQTVTGTWTGAGTDTVGAGQQGSLTAKSDVIRFSGRLGAPNNNVAISVGGSASIPLFETVDARANLPAPTTVLSGTTYIVVDDPTPALNGVVTAFGPRGAQATGWSS